MAGDTEHNEIIISTGHDLPDGSIPIRAIEIVMFLNPSGSESAALRYQGTPNIVAELGMVEYAKGLIIASHNGER
jgi:hypothetical protein